MHHDFAEQRVVSMGNSVGDRAETVPVKILADHKYLFQDPKHVCLSAGTLKCTATCGECLINSVSLTRFMNMYFNDEPRRVMSICLRLWMTTLLSYEAFPFAFSFSTIYFLRLLHAPVSVSCLFHVPQQQSRLHGQWGWMDARWSTRLVSRCARSMSRPRHARLHLCCCLLQVHIPSYCSIYPVITNTTSEVLKTWFYIWNVIDQTGAGILASWRIIPLCIFVSLWCYHRRNCALRGPALFSVVVWMVLCVLFRRSLCGVGAAVFMAATCYDPGTFFWKKCAMFFYGWKRHFISRDMLIEHIAWLPIFRTSYFLFW